MFMSRSADELKVPHLESGDRLDRAEFERRYTAWPGIKKAELIEGVVYMPSPTRQEHAEPHGHLVTWLGVYAARTPPVRVSDNGTVRMDPTNEPQPDVALRLPGELGGCTRLDDDGYLVGAPELIVEVSHSSASYDLGPKKHVYLRNGVQEYVVFRVDDSAVDWFSLREGTYQRLVPGSGDVFRSIVFPGLWLDPVALVAGRLDGLLDTLDLGLRSPEHAAFVARLGTLAAR